MNTISALRIGGETAMGYMGEPPISSGNCFWMETQEGYFKIVNFYVENLRYLLKQGLTWPVELVVLDDQRAVIHDKRIPATFYASKYCGICCPEELHEKIKELSTCLAHKERESKKHENQAQEVQG